MNSSSASFSRCACCEASWPKAAMPKPMAATISNRPRYVKPCCLPALISLRAALHVIDVALLALLSRRRDRDPGARAARERVGRDGAQVALGHQLVERAGVLAGVGVVLVERLAHHG